MERISERENLNRAYKRVKGNRGGVGVDGMTDGELSDWLRVRKEELVEWILDGSYELGVVLGRRSRSQEAGSGGWGYLES